MPAPYIGTVEDVKDPLGLGRIRVRVSEIHGESSSPQWAWPTNGVMAGSGRGFFFVPRVGDLVRVEFHQGNPARPIWTSGNWTNGAGVAPLPAEFAGQGNQDPLRQGFATERWVQVMDDSTPGEMKMIDRDTGAEIRMKDDGAIEMVDADGATLILNPTGDKIEFDDTGGTLTMDRTKIEAITAAGVKWTIDALKFEAVDKVSQKITMDGIGQITINPLSATGLINLVLGATDFLVKGTTFFTLHNFNVIQYNAHTHDGAVGTPKPSDPGRETMDPMIAGTHISLQVKTK